MMTDKESEIAKILLRSDAKYMIRFWERCSTLTNEEKKVISAGSVQILSSSSKGYKPLSKLISNQLKKVNEVKELNFYQLEGSQTVVNHLVDAFAHKALGNLLQTHIVRPLIDFLEEEEEEENETDVLGFLLSRICQCSTLLPPSYSRLLNSIRNAISENFGTQSALVLVGSLVLRNIAYPALQEEREKSLQKKLKHYFHYLSPLAKGNLDPTVLPQPVYKVLVANFSGLLPLWEKWSSETGLEMVGETSPSKCPFSLLANLVCAEQASWERRNDISKFAKTEGVRKLLPFIVKYKSSNTIKFPSSLRNLIANTVSVPRLAITDQPEMDFHCNLDVFNPNSILLLEKISTMMEQSSTDIVNMTSSLVFAKENSPFEGTAEFYTKDLAQAFLSLVISSLKRLIQISSGKESDPRCSWETIKSDCHSLGESISNFLLPCNSIPTLVAAFKEAYSVVLKEKAGLTQQPAHATAISSDLLNEGIKSLKEILALIVGWVTKGWNLSQLDSKSVREVSRSWEKVRNTITNCQDVGQAFYKLLFKRFPAVIPLFENTDMDAQASHLSSILDLVISSSQPLTVFSSALEELGARHVGYGTLPAHYEAVGSVLVQLLSVVLKDHWNERVQSSWIKLYTRLSCLMIRAQERRVKSSSNRNNLMHLLKREYGFAEERVIPIPGSFHEPSPLSKLVSGNSLSSLSSGVVHRAVKHALANTEVFELSAFALSPLTVDSFLSSVNPALVVRTFLGYLESLNPTPSPAIRAAIFPGHTVDGIDSHDFVCWNPSLFSFAGYLQEDSSVIGNRANVLLTQRALQYGWIPPENRSCFDLLPLILQRGEEVHLLEIPSNIVSNFLIRIPVNRLVSSKHSMQHVLIPRIGTLFPSLCMGGYHFQFALFTFPPFVDLIIHELKEQYSCEILDFRELSNSISQAFQARNSLLLKPEWRSEQESKRQMLRIHLGSCSNNTKEEEVIVIRRELHPNLYVSVPLNPMQQLDQITSSILILYGTDTGTSLGQARSLLMDLSRMAHGTSDVVQMMGMDQFSKTHGIQELIQYKMVFFITSTRGGKAPANARHFSDELEQLSSLNSAGAFSFLMYAVFGNCSANHKADYNSFARKIDATLASVKAQRILSLGVGDDMLMQYLYWESWRESLILKLKDLLTVSNSSICHREGSKGKSTFLSSISRLKKRKTPKGSDGKAASFTISLPSPTSAKPKKQKSKQMDDNLLAQRTKSPEGSDADSESSYFSTSESDISEVSVVATILENVELIPSSKKGKSVRSILVQLPPLEELSFLPGDHLAVYPENKLEQVESLTNVLNVNLEDILQIGQEKQVLWFPYQCTVQDALTRYVDLSVPFPSYPLLEGLLKHTKKSSDRQVLSSLASVSRAIAKQEKVKTGKRTSKIEKWKDPSFLYRSVVELLAFVPSCRPSLIDLLILLQAMKPRLYSIGTSPNLSRNQLRLTVGVETLVHPTRPSQVLREGLCSTYLAEAKPEKTIHVKVIGANFSPPSDPHRPILLVAAGTGLSPFLGFLEHRAHTAKIPIRIEAKADKPSKESAVYKGTPAKGLGEAMLLFGCREPGFDDLYIDDLTKLVDSGVISHLEYAWSRHPKQAKKYVQDALVENESEVHRLLAEGAILYVCGDVRLFEGVTESLVLVLMRKGDMTRGAAIAKIQQMKNQGSFVVDCWGVAFGPQYFQSLQEHVYAQSHLASQWATKRLLMITVEGKDLGPLAPLLRYNDFELVHLLMENDPEHASSIVACLHHPLALDAFRGSSVECARALLSSVLARHQKLSTEKELTTFLRTDRPFHSLVSAFLSFWGKTALSALVKPLVTAVMVKDETRSRPHKAVHQVSAFLERFLDSSLPYSKEFLVGLRMIVDMVCRYCVLGDLNAESARHRVSFTYLFLRLICVAIVFPDKYKLSTLPPNSFQLYSLAQISKVLLFINKGIDGAIPDKMLPFAGLAESYSIRIHKHILELLDTSPSNLEDFDMPVADISRSLRILTGYLLSDSSQIQEKLTGEKLVTDFSLWCVQNDKERHRPLLDALSSLDQSSSDDTEESSSNDLFEMEQLMSQGGNLKELMLVLLAHDLPEGDMKRDDFLLAFPLYWSPFEVLVAIQSILSENKVFARRVHLFLVAMTSLNFDLNDIAEKKMNSLIAETWPNQNAPPAVYRPPVISKVMEELLDLSRKQTGNEVVGVECRPKCSSEMLADSLVSISSSLFAHATLEFAKWSGEVPPSSNLPAVNAIYTFHDLLYRLVVLSTLAARKNPCLGQLFEYYMKVAQRLDMKGDLLSASCIVSALLFCSPTESDMFELPYYLRDLFIALCRFDETESGVLLAESRISMLRIEARTEMVIPPFPVLRTQLQSIQSLNNTTEKGLPNVGKLIQLGHLIQQSTFGVISNDGKEGNTIEQEVAWKTLKPLLYEEQLPSLEKIRVHFNHVCTPVSIMEIVDNYSSSSQSEDSGFY